MSMIDLTGRVGGNDAAVAALTKAVRPATMPTRRLGMRGIYSKSDMDAANAWLGGLLINGVLVFCELSNGASSWAQNVQVTRDTVAGLSWLYAAGGWADYAVPLCSGTPGSANQAANTAAMTDVSLGKYDAEIYAIAKAIAAADPNPRIPVRLGWEGNFANAYPWTYNYSGGEALYITVYRRVADIFRSVDSRFFFVWVNAAVVTQWDVSMDWRNAYPGDAYVDALGCDPYFIASLDTTGGQSSAISLVINGNNANNGLNNMYAFAVAHSKPFAFNEIGVDQDGSAYLFDLCSWMYGKNIAYVNYWNQGTGGGAWACKITDDSKPTLGAAFRAEFGPGSPYARTGSGSWSPADLGSRLRAWWTPSRIDRMTFSGAAVTNWFDVKARGTLTQATAAAQPTYAATGINNNPAVLFDGGDSLAGLYSITSGATEIDVWAVVRNDDTVLSSTRACFRIGGGGYTKEIRLQIQTSGVYQMAVPTGAGAFGPAGAVATKNDLVLLRGKVRATWSQIEVNGVAGAIISGVPGVAGTDVSIGSLASVGSPWLGAIGSVLVTDPLTPAEAEKMSAYLKARFGMT